MLHSTRRLALAATLSTIAAGCDQGTYRPVEDSSTDTVLDTGVDPGVDEGTVLCEYPDGPYGFNAVGDIVGPMDWPSAVAGPVETLAADLAVLHCDPDIHSIFVQISTTSCAYCPARLSEIAGMHDHWNTHGAKWIFVVADASDAAAADAYVGTHGPTFGWRTHDGDNSLAIDAIAASAIYGGVPWTGVIRATDMQLVYDEPDTSYLDIRAIAAELAE